MEIYQINDLERLTGIKAHTIRIWEKRFNLITPHRTATNIRYYDDEQVRHLLNIATLVEHGYKISAIAALTDSEVADMIHTIHNEAEANTDAVSAAFVSDLIAATIVFDEPAFEKIFASAVTRLGMYKTILAVVYPFLVKVGLLWSSDKIASVQEHFSSNIIRRKLLSAIDGLLPAHKKTKKFLLFLPPDEWHEISLLFSDYLIRSAGYATIYLGQNVPYGSLKQAIKDTRPSHLLTFYISRRQQDEMLKQLKDLLAGNKDLQILVGGTPDLFRDIRLPVRTTYLSEPEHLLQDL